MVELPGGTFTMGTDTPGYPADGEGPARPVILEPFAIDTYAVTNRRFAAFVDDTGFITEVENFGWSFVFAGLLPDDFPPTRGVVGAEWWRQVEGACWQHPFGPQSDLVGLGDHPVVQVTWNDALAFCDWSGTELPTEAQWEYAARGGLENTVFPWGDELEPNGQHMMNVWQGTFPVENSQADGFYGTAPVGSFPPNGFGLYDMTGNVWEWCSDWFDADHTDIGVVMKGGSYMCHASYCHRYRPAARRPNTIDSSAGNVGFRCVSRL